MSLHRSDDALAHAVPETHDTWGTGDEPVNLVEQAAIEVGTFLDNMFGGREEQEEGGDDVTQGTAGGEGPRPGDRNQS